MQELTYASKSIVTTDTVAEALLDLVTAINRHDHSEAVTVPAFTDEGALIEAHMTLDAGSELVSVPSLVDFEVGAEDREAVEAAVEKIRSRVRGNQRLTVVATPVDPGTETDAYDYDGF